jgi:hypothetical protein
VNTPKINPIQLQIAAFHRHTDLGKKLSKLKKVLSSSLPICKPDFVLQDRQLASKASELPFYISSLRTVSQPGTCPALPPRVYDALRVEAPSVEIAAGPSAAEADEKECVPAILRQGSPDDWEYLETPIHPLELYSSTWKIQRNPERFFDRRFFHPSPNQEIRYAPWIIQRPAYRPRRQTWNAFAVHPKSDKSFMPATSLSSLFHRLIPA